MELWLPIEDYENYSISTIGNIRNNSTNLILKQTLNNCGYRIVTLINNKIKKNKYVHRLIAQTFIINATNYKLVDHIDQNRSNNNIDNLRWVDYSINGKNAKIPKNNTSGIIGVSIEKGKYRAVWSENCKKKTKSFNNLDDAIAHRKLMEEQHNYSILR